jgi:hypothetical protein
MNLLTTIDVYLWYAWNRPAAVHVLLARFDARR